MTTPENGHQGTLTPNSTLGEFNAQSFLITQLINRVHTMTLVKVLAIGYDAYDNICVTVQPLIDQVDGFGNPVPHGTLLMPILMLQGGSGGVIVEPAPGDIGLAIFAERDISSVVINKQQGAPSSNRKYSMSDGVYLGGTLNAIPTTKVAITASGVEIQGADIGVSSTNQTVLETPHLSVSSEDILWNQIGGEGAKALITDLFITLFNAHTHTIPTGTSGAPVVPMTSAYTTAP